MLFRNYCIVVMGNTVGVVKEIHKVSEIEPNVLDAKGLLIATFSSVVEPKELTAFFTLNKRNFLLFDLNPNNSGFNIQKKEISNGLFSFLTEMNAETLVNKTNDLMYEIENDKQVDTIQSLEEQLQTAVSLEDFELAVKLRDKINKLKT